MSRRGLGAALICAGLALGLWAARPAGAEVMYLPAGTETVEEQAFYGDKSLDTAVLPEGVLTVGAQAFAASGLRRAVLPASLTAIADDAFAGLSGLTVIAPKDSYAWRWAGLRGYARAVRSRAESLPQAGETDQLVLVEYLGGSSARVSLNEKQDGVWVELSAYAGFVGAAGIGKQREGDRKTPSGAYRLKTPFGILEDPGSRLPYTRVTATMYWCGTSGSPYYNRLCDSVETGRAPAASDEVLISYRGYYDYAMFIAYNEEGEKDKGSCIFLHCAGTKTSTAGCVAIPKAGMIEVIRWAGENALIVICPALE